MIHIITTSVITHLETDTLECEVKWALGSITMNKANRGDGIPFELFQILKHDVVKVLHSICQQIWKTQQWPQDWENVSFVPIPKKGNAKKMHKLPHNCTHLTHWQSNPQNSPSQASTVRELWTSRHSSWIQGRGTRDQIANICWITEKAREIQKNFYFCFIDHAKAFDCVDHCKLENS